MGLTNMYYHTGQSESGAMFTVLWILRGSRVGVNPSRSFRCSIRDDGQELMETSWFDIYTLVEFCWGVVKSLCF